MNSRTTIVSVAYNSAQVLETMLRSVPAGVPVIVVDNASADASAEIAEKAGARIERLASNLGFGPGCNAGAKLAATEFLLFLNPDAALGDGAIETLEAAADRYPDASAFNPRISDKDGGQYFKRRSALLPGSAALPRGWPEDDRVVPILSGAAYFCRRTCFVKVGGFDPAIFLYHEDDDLALRMQAQCGPLLFVREALVVHQEGRSSPRSPQVAAFKAYHQARSRVYAMRKHGVPMAFVRSLGTATLKLLSPATLFSARKRAQALAFFRGVLSARLGKNVVE